MKVLIGFDGSDSAKEAIEDLRFAGLPGDTEALIVTVTESWLPSDKPDEDTFSELLDDDIKWPWRNKALERVAQCEEFALDAWERLRSIFPQWQITHEVTGGYPEWAIVAKANEFKPDLIVVGSQGRSNVGRFVLGSVALKVLSEAPCSVRVARPSSRRKKDDESPLRLLAGVDGSPDSRQAIDSIIRRQWPGGTEVRLVTAVGLLDHPGADDRAKGIVEIRRSASRDLNQAGLNVSDLVKPGRAKDLLLEEAEAWNADSIFLGAKGRRFMERILLGSVSYAVASRAICSVEVAKAIDKDRSKK
ncbi:MAG TPA: universal stress protein [Aridibacter sp.]|nr:universal stress protein [Aridibacter sp.]